jgi:hypothetical protein
MMRKKEQRLWDRTKSAFDKHSMWYERVENMVGVGTPDLHVMGRRAVMIELKAVDVIPARPTTPLLGKSDGLSVEQENWHHAYCNARGLSFVLIGIGSHEQILMPGTMSFDINKLPHDDLIATCCAFGNRKTGWEPIITYLKTET